MNPGCSGIRYERAGDRVQPVKFRREWVTFKNGNEAVRKFITVRVTEVGFPRANYAEPEPWGSFPATRAGLMKAGFLWRV